MFKKPKIWLLVLLLLFGVVLLWPLPEKLFRVPYSTVITDKNGNLLAGQIAVDGQWRFPSGDSISHKFEKALLLFEDENFYKHPGINPFSIGRAIRQNMEAGRVVSGGSTITMQVARLIRGRNERNIFNKAVEMILTLKLELYLSKTEILELYASHAPFGGNVVGVEAAAWRYYARPSDQLSWAEAATLAVLPNNPSAIYPGKSHEALKAKRDRLLDKLYSRNILNEIELKLSKAEPLPGKANDIPDLAKHLLTRIIKDEKQGRHIKTTIDKGIQQKVGDKVQRHHQQLSGNEVHNAAALVIEVSTGNVLAYIGNTSTAPVNSPHVDIITSGRSTGSILKPLLYGLAIDEGIITPEQLLPDIPVFFKGFAPQNFNNTFEGAVRASEALKKSLNVPFVYLLRDYSYEQFHQDLKDLGLSGLNQPPGHYGLSLILGGAEASIWDLTATYAGLVRTLDSYYAEGAAADYREGKLFENRYDLAEEPHRTRSNISAGAVWWMFKGMQQLQRPEEMSGWHHFASSRKIAWKTGTSYGHRDAWAIGTDGKYVVGVWAGNADGEGRPGLTGIQAAAPLMFDIFDIFPGENDFLSTPPAEMPAFEICARSGFIASLNCTDKRKVYLPEKASLASPCPYHQLVHFDKLKKFQVNADCYPASDIVTEPWFKLPPVQSWYYKSRHADYKVLPDFHTSCTTNTGSKMIMQFIYPADKTKIYVPVEIDGKPGRCVFEAAHNDREAVLYWHLDGKYIGSTEKIHQMSLNPSFGKHELMLLDENGYELTMQIEVLSQG